MKQLNKISNLWLKIGSLFVCILVSLLFYSGFLWIIYSVNGVMVDSDFAVNIPSWVMASFIGIAVFVGVLIGGRCVSITKAWTLAELAQLIETESIARHAIYLIEARIKDLNRKDLKK